MRIPELAASRVTEKIKAGEYSVKLSRQQYLKHIEGTAQYEQYLKTRIARGQGPQSILTISEEDTQQLLRERAGTGIVLVDKTGEMRPIELINANRIVGRTMSGNEWIETSKVKIFYGKDSSHMTPIGGMNFD